MITLRELLERTLNMQFCDVCNTPAIYHVANPGSNTQTFCEEHLPKFLKVTMPFVTLLTQVPNVTVIEEPVVEEPVVEEPTNIAERFPDINRSVETPAPKTRKKAAAVPVEELVTE